MDKRIFLYHPDERVRNIILDRLVGVKNLILHPSDGFYQLKSMVSVVPSCDMSVFLVDFKPDGESPLYREVKSLCPFSEVILLIYAAHMAEAAALVERGTVYDYLVVSPFYDVYTVRIKVLRALERCLLRTKLVELKRQVMEARKCVDPAVETLTTNLCKGVKEESHQLKRGVSKVVVDAERDLVEDLFCRFDSSIEHKLQDFGDDVVSLTSSFADAVSAKAVNAVNVAVEPPEPEEAVEKGGKRVLIISDQYTLRDLLRVFLSTQGLEVVEVGGDPKDIEKVAKMEPIPDLILLDMDLEKELSFEVLSKLSKESSLKNIPVILLTHTKTREMLKKAAHYPVAGIILKPFKFSVVKEKVEEALQRDSVESEVASPERDSFFIRWRREDQKK